MNFRKIRRSAAALVIAITSAVLLTACGGSKKTVDVDVEKLADELNSSVVTSDQLSKTESTMLPSIYFWDEADVSNAVAYMSSGATADEICVVECADASKTSGIEKLFQTRVDNQSELYASYNEPEVDKLKDAIIKSAGKYTVLVVSDDQEKAGEILTNYGF